MKQQSQRKPRILCLHGYGTSAKILKTLVLKWPENILKELDLVFLDGPFLARGKSGAEGIFDPPYYVWFYNNQDFSKFTNLEECVVYIENFMIKYGPFDGVLGFSQGGVLSSAMPGMQEAGVAFTKVPKIKFLIIISGGKFGGKKFGLPKLAAQAFSSPVKCPSLHFFGEVDFQKEEAIALLDSFVDPLVIKHPGGHTVPKLADEKNGRIMLSFIENIKKIVAAEAEDTTNFEMISPGKSRL